MKRISLEEVEWSPISNVDPSGRVFYWDGGVYRAIKHEAISFLEGLFNAFFIRNPFGENEIPEMPIKECFKHPKVLWGMKERFPLVQDLPWVEV
jgi:hypothetical protein